jgi:hypothetical protein
MAGAASQINEGSTVQEALTHCGLSKGGQTYSRLPEHSLSTERSVLSLKHDGIEPQLAQ